MKRRMVLAAASVWMTVMLTACGSGTVDNSTVPTETPAASSPAETASQQPESEVTEEPNGEEQMEMKMNVQVGSNTFTATLEDNEAVGELVEMMKEGPVTIYMDDFGGFEKVGALKKRLTTSDSQTTTTAGDIVLYNGNNIVMFYGSNTWSYTRIGKIDDLTGWEKALGRGSFSATFTLAD